MFRSSLKIWVPAVSLSNTTFWYGWCSSSLPSQYSRCCSQAQVQVWVRSQTPQRFWTAPVVGSVLQEQLIKGSSLGPPRQPTPAVTTGTWSSPQEMWVLRIAQRASRQLLLLCRLRQHQGHWFRWCCCGGTRYRWLRPPSGRCRRRWYRCCCCGRWSRACRAAAGNSSSSSSSCGAICVSSSSGGNHFSREDGPYRWFKETLKQRE